MQLRTLRNTTRNLQETKSVTTNLNFLPYARCPGRSLTSLDAVVGSALPAELRVADLIPAKDAIDFRYVSVAHALRSPQWR